MQVPTILPTVAQKAVLTKENNSCISGEEISRRQMMMAITTLAGGWSLVHSEPVQAVEIPISAQCGECVGTGVNSCALLPRLALL